MQNINFLPWQGKNFAQGYRGKKILVLGESHYTEDGKGWQSITQDVMERYINYITGKSPFEARWMNTFTKFAKAFQNGEMSNEEVAQFWQGVVFYNFVQFPTSGPRVAPTAQQFADSEKAFREVFAQYKPDIVIAWGGRLWENISSELKAQFPMMFVMHPSASGFQYATVYEQLKKIF